jgi:hypothetical protein
MSAVSMPPSGNVKDARMIRQRRPICWEEERRSVKPTPDARRVPQPSGTEGRESQKLLTGRWSFLLEKVAVWGLFVLIYSVFPSIESWWPSLASILNWLSINRLQVVCQSMGKLGLVQQKTIDSKDDRHHLKIGVGHITRCIQLPYLLPLIILQTHCKFSRSRHSGSSAK